MKPRKSFIPIIALVLLLVLSVSSITQNRLSIVNASGSDLGNVSGTGEDYGDLLQYEWPQFQGNPSFTHFSAGPAPEAADILWKVNISGIQSYVSAFNSMVFVANSTTLFALDKETGSTIWNTTIPSMGRWPAAYKIDDTHLVIGSCSLDIETGRVLWTSPTFSTNVANWAAGAYSPEEKMFFVKTNSFIQGWDFSNPSMPPTLVWETYVQGTGSIGSGVQYGDGMVFPGSFESHQMALNATNGDVLWDVETTGAMEFDGSYSDGKFFRGSPFDNTFYCFNATTGEILWRFSPGTDDGYWCAGSAVAYGMAYALNKDGHLYAIDVQTGDLVWKYKGPGPLFFPGNPTVADGKVYATTGQRASYDPAKGNYSHSEFACLDAYTGNVIWTMDTEAFPPRESVAIAYGNIYLIPAFIKALQMDEYTIMDQVWAIGTRDWPMFRHDPTHSAAGQSGPTNLTLRWKFPASGAVVSSPSTSEGRIFFGSEDKNIYCVDARSGSLIWKFNTSGRILSSPAVVNGKVYVGPDDGNIYCIDAYNGSLIWSTYAGGYVEAPFSAAVMLRSSPTIIGNRLYVGALDTNVYCLDADNGDIKWKFKTDGYITSSPAVMDGVVYIVSQEPNSAGLYQLGASNGNLIRRIAIPYEQASRGTDMHSSPAVASGTVFAASNKFSYYAINVTTGNVTWTFRDPEAGEFIICSPIYNNGVVYLVDEFFIEAVNATDGAHLWQSFLGTEFYVSPTYADGKLYVTSDQRGLYVLNATDGTKLAWFATGSNSWSSPILYEGRVYVGCNDWNVYCLAQYPALNSSITLKTDNPNATLGETVDISGQLVPGMTNESVTLSFARPDGSVKDFEVATLEKGVFNVAYPLNMVGDWSIVAMWQSNRGYYDNAHSETLRIQVSEVPAPPNDGGTQYNIGLTKDQIYVILIAAVAIVLAISSYLCLRRIRK